MSEMPMRFGGAVFVLCGVWSMQGCGNSDLSRPQAKEKIAAALKFPVEYTVKVPKLMEIAGFGGDTLVKDLQKSPLLKVTKAPSILFDRFSVEFTEQGRKLLTSDPGGRTIKACTVKMGEVTGIQLDGGKKKAEVEFELLVDTNITARFLEPKGGLDKACVEAVGSNRGESSGVAIKAKRNLALFDDGWRVVD